MAQLSKLIQRALEGEEIIIAKGPNNPLVRLQVIQPKPTKRILGRHPGLLLSMAPDFGDTPADFEDYER